MTAPGNDLVQIVLALAFVIASGYALGRIHQWYKHGLERDGAYREGYNHASRSMFDLVVRNRTGKLAPAAHPAGPRSISPAVNPAGVAAEPNDLTNVVGLARRRINPNGGHRRAAS
jgi:hypothetical protein